jgi:tRNA pseudouridine13 synthase
LFNRALSRRIEEGLFQKVLRGDVLRRSDSGGLFVCEEPDLDQPRMDLFEVSPTGPLFGPKMTRAEGAVGAAEERLLSEEALTVETFARGKGETEGGRRPFRIPLSTLRWSFEGADLLVEVELPKGTYATVLLGEVQKSEGTAAEMDE